MNVVKKQCVSCPWKKSVTPDEDIPGGYDIELHKSLKSTIAEPGVYDPDKPLRVMACHKSKTGSEYPCVGWLDNQLNQGDNIALRIRAIHEDFSGLVLEGEQHESFDDTLKEI